MESTLTKKQVKTFTKIVGNEKYIAEVRYDDECGNGHNSFAITCDTYEQRNNGRWVFSSGGCDHDTVEKHFPQLAPFIKWHLCSSDGPMHYTANVMYHASNKDCWGKAKGEPYSFERSFKFGDFPIVYRTSNNKFREFIAECLEMVELKNSRESVFDFEVIQVDHDDRDTYGSKYTWGGFQVNKWHECPFDTEERALQVLEAFQNYPVEVILTATQWGKGKEPGLESARSCAIWPDATLEQLQNKETLEARLPGLLEEFKTDVQGLGFVY